MKNLFRLFQDTVGERPRRAVGVCVAADFAECTVELPGEIYERVQGAGTVGTRYFIEGMRLAGEAPDLPSMVVEIP